MENEIPAKTAKIRFNPHQLTGQTMKFKEFAQLDKYPYANENIRQEIAQNVKALDDVLEAIQNDPTITKEAKTLLKYQKGKEFMQKLTQSIQKSIQTREIEAKKLREQFKSVQLRKEPLKEEQKAVMGIVYQELKSGNLDIFAKQNDNLLKIALTLADNGLIDDISGQIDMMYSNEAVEGYLAQKELIEFEQSSLKELAEYEEIGLNKEEALRIYHQTYKGNDDQKAKALYRALQKVWQRLQNVRGGRHR